MSVSKKFLSGSQKLSNNISWVLSEILYFNDCMFKISELFVSLELASALNSSLNEDNLKKIELPFNLSLIANSNATIIEICNFILFSTV